MHEPLVYPYFSGRKLHLGVCGSVAAYKAAELLRTYQRAGFHVSVTVTPSAVKFISPLTFEALGATRVYTHMFGQDEGTSFAHLEPGAMADCFVLAPLSASTMARLVAGQADELLAAQALAFEGPLVLAPAMNPRMWGHPATQHNRMVLEERGAHFVQPDQGTVACGDVGAGKLAHLSNIYLATLKALAPQDLAGTTVVITLGPTREQWDGVRYWTNPSTGKMGTALAVAAWLRGATVHAITGPGVGSLPQGIHQYGVTSARQMFDQANSLWDEANIGIFTAAVADFSPEPFGASKFKKSSSANGFSINFTPNADILATLAGRKQSHQRVLGFAAETDNLAVNVQDKLIRKHCDIVAGNLIGVEGSGFGANTNKMIIADKNGVTEEYSSITKNEAAWRLLDWLLSL